MTNVKIRIEVNPNSESEDLGDIQNQVDGIPSSENVSNVSVKINGDGLFQELPSKSGGINGLSLAGDLVFDEFGLLDNPNLKGGVLESTESPIEFIWGVVPDNGEYKVRLVFTDAESLKDVIIYGDSVVNQFPTQAIIDGSRVIYNDDLQWAINFGEESDTHVIEFTHWNLKNYNACISKIAVMLKYLEVDKHNGLKEIESTSQASSDTTGLYYGSIENFGSIEIVDTTGEIVEMIRDGIIDNSNTNLEVVANEQVIQTHISTDSSFDMNTKILSLDLGNKINSLDILKYKGYEYPDHSETLDKLLFDVLSNLKYVLGTEDLTEDEFKNMLSDKYNETLTLYDYLASCLVTYPVIEPNKTYREIIDEFCLIAQMQMFIDDSGNIKFVSARPKVFDEDFKAIHIPKGNMFSQLNYNLILKNKYDGVEISKTKISNTQDIDVAIYSEEDYDTQKISQTMNLNVFNNSENLDLQYSFRDASNVFSTAVTALKVVNYYATGNLKIPQKQNNNLIKILNINNNIFINDRPLFTIFCDKLENSCSVDIQITRNRVNNTFTLGTPQTLNINAPLQKVEDFSGYLSQEYSTTKDDGYWGTTSTSKVLLNDESSYNVTFDGTNYNVDFKILCGQDIVSVGGNYVTENNNDSAIINPLINMTGLFTRYKPKYISFSINGDKRIISFEEISFSTENIESAKTKVSLGSSNLLQKDRMVENIKKNILSDYYSGISSGTVNVSCSDYYDSNGNKVIDWSKGDVLRVGDIVYFDKDIYNDGSQRYWKIKGRTFRKTGVAMQDLELEEVKPKKSLESYTWDEINKISQLGIASSEFSLGDTKKIELDNGKTITARIVGFNHDELASSQTKAGITFVVNDLDGTSPMGTLTNDYTAWSNSIVRNDYLTQLYNKIPSLLQKHIKLIKKNTLTGDYNMVDGYTVEETQDHLWLFGYEEIFGENPYVSEDPLVKAGEGTVYNYVKENAKEIFKYPGVQTQYWLRTVTVNNLKYNNYIVHNKQSSIINITKFAVEQTRTSTNNYNVVFGFCI